MRIFGVLLIFFFAVGLVSAQNEIAPIGEKMFDYKDWIFKSVDSGKDVNLRKFASGKKLVMVVYWAPWCHNWEYDVSFVESLYKKYKGDGFEVIGVAEYDPVDKMKDHIKSHNVTFTNVYESVSSAEREKTTHFSQRREAGDARRWGSPWYVFLAPGSLEPEGQAVLSKKPMVVNGELKRDEVERYIRQQLGLDKAGGTVSSNSKSIEACLPDKKTAEFKKP